jgi:hypothetical protein
MLTNEQIGQLYIFCEKRFVHFYDVQVELVDHLANAIEAKMAADEKLDFQTALTRVHADFGPLGFAGFVNSQFRLLDTKYSRLKSKFFKRYFTLPTIAFTICTLLVLWLMPQALTNGQLGVFTVAFVVGVSVYEIYIVYIHWHKVKKQPKPLMLTQYGPERSWFSFFALAQFMILGLLYDGRHVISLWVYQILITWAFLLLLSLTAYREASMKLVTDARVLYPEAFEVQ